MSVCPDATLVDIGHEIPPHDVLAGALELAACYRYFPAGTVFLVVVDPGVGSSRRGIAADTGDYKFVAPDNGVLSAVFEETPPKRVVELTERKYARPTVSRTFEGRDRFAPAAGWLAKGIELVWLGKSISDYHRLDLPRPAVSRRSRSPGKWCGSIASAISSPTSTAAVSINWPTAARWPISAGAREVGRLVATYAEAAPGRAVRALRQHRPPRDRRECGGRGRGARAVAGRGRQRGAVAPERSNLLRFPVCPKGQKADGLTVNRAKVDHGI